jgi:hypothetical protein
MDVYISSRPLILCPNVSLVCITRTKDGGHHVLRLPSGLPGPTGKWPNNHDTVLNPYVLILTAIPTIHCMSFPPPKAQGPHAMAPKGMHDHDAFLSVFFAVIVLLPL